MQLGWRPRRRRGEDAHALAERSGAAGALKDGKKVDEGSRNSSKKRVLRTASLVTLNTVLYYLSAKLGMELSVGPLSLFW
jgi:hypothetical protein